MFQDRWLGLVLCLCMLGCAGMSGSFALYSPILKSVGGYDQRKIGALAVAKDLGEALGILPGLLCDFLPLWMLLLVGSAHFSLGFGVLWLVCSKLISVPSFFMVFMLLLVASQGTAWLNTVALVTCLRNFPKSRGTVVGLLKGLVGLSSAIYTELYSSLLAPNQAAFPALLAAVPLLVVIPSMFFVRPATRSLLDSPKKEAENLRYLMAICFCLAFYLSSVNILQEVLPLSREVRLLTLAGMLALIILLFWAPLSYQFGEEVQSKAIPHSAGYLNPSQGSAFSSALLNERQGLSLTKPLLPRSESLDSLYFDLSPKASEADARGWPVPTGMQREILAVTSQHESQNESDCSQSTVPVETGELSSSAPSNLSILGDVEDRDIQVQKKQPSVPPRKSIQRRSSRLALAVGEGAIHKLKRKGPRRGEDFRLSQAILKADFWLLAFGFMCGCGSALTAINNLAQMGTAQGYGNVRIFVSLISIWSFVGRLGGGYISEELVRKCVQPRAIMLLLAQAGMSLGHICFAIAFRGSMHIGCIIIGMCYGVHWSVMPAIVSELFGLLHFGMLFNVVATAMPLGSFLFSSLIAGTLYDYEAQKDNHQTSVPAFTLSSGLLQDRAVTHDCIGAHCFRLTFLCMFVACCVGVLLNLVLVLRTRVVYRTLYGENPTSGPRQEQQ